MNGRRYGKSSQSTPRVLLGNLQQSLNLALPPSATLTLPPLLTTPSPLFPTLPTPTPILTPQTTSTTPTPPHQPQALSPLSHPSYSPNNHAWKIQKNCLHYIHSLHHTDLNHHLHNHVRNYHLPQKSSSKMTKQSTQITIPKRHPPTLSPFVSTDIRLKRHKNYPLPFAHQRSSLTTHPTTSSTSFTTSTTKTSLSTTISTIPVQSPSTAPIHYTCTTSTTPIHNTFTTIINTTTPTTTINTTTPTGTIGSTTTTNTATQTKISPLMELIISLPPSLCTPSTSLTIPLPSSSPPSLIFPGALKELHQSGLWETLLPAQQQRPKEITITWQF